MKKILFLFAVSVFLTACQTQSLAPVQPKCPSCDPPVRHFEVVTKCSNYTEKDLGNGNFSQCRYCTNRIFSNGVDVTESFKGGISRTDVKTRKASLKNKNRNSENPCLKK